MSVEQGDAKFVSKLDEVSKKKAKDELHELNDADRALAVQTFRAWVLQQKDWLNTPTDFEFLLRFLRVRKFSQLGARETLENYWTCKTKSPEWFKNIDPADESVQEVFKSGFYTCPKQYDDQGRRLIIIQFGGLEKMLNNGIGIDACYRAVSLMYDWLILDENVQVNGVHVIFDYKNMGMSTILTSASNGRNKRFMDFFKKSLPMRVKGYMLYNEPPFVDAMMAIYKPLMRQKMIDRLHYCGSKMTRVYEHVDKYLLPREYLPDDHQYDHINSLQKMTDDMVSDMMKPEFQDYIRKLNGGEYGVNLDKRANDKHEPEESFRRLKVD